MICVPCVVDEALEHSQAIRGILDQVFAQTRSGAFAQGDREDMDSELIALSGAHPHTCGEET